MAPADVAARVDGPLSVVARGVAFTAGAGAVVGGVVGTIDWPVVATFFAAMGGVVIGALTGAVDGLVLALVARWSWSAWSARVVSGLVWLTAALLTTSVSHEFVATRHLAGRLAIVGICLVLGAACGPLIARGLEPLTRARGITIEHPQLSEHLLRWGANGGGGLGAIVGLTIGIRAYLPTSPLALVEGAILGTVSGVVLAVLFAGIAVLPRLRARR